MSTAQSTATRSGLARPGGGRRRLDLALFVIATAQLPPPLRLYRAVWKPPYAKVSHW